MVETIFSPVFRSSPFERVFSVAAPPVFTPSSLFPSGTVGVWLDPSDLSTMFSGRLATTPVTAPGQTVGIRLDKSKGLVQGPELVTNGTFDSPTGWILTSSIISGGTLNVSTASSTVTATGTSVSAATGTPVLVTFDVTSYTSGSIRAEYRGVNSSYVNALGSFSFFGVVSAGGAVQFRTNGATVLSVDNISVKELPGNHAVAPTDASRPVYGVEPKTGRRNLLLATDTLATQSLTVTAATHTLAFTGTGTVTLSGASTSGPLVGTGAGNRVSLTFTPTAASLTLTVSGSVTLAQLELGSTATAYQRVTTAFDVTEAGVPSCHYIQYDGTDDSLSTPAINLTLTDAMSVFAGVFKRTDATLGMLLELGANADSVNGSFSLRAPSATASASYSYLSRGTALAQAESPTSYPAPIYSLVSGLSDISVDQCIIRVNGTQVASSASDQGTGNYGNQALFIGRRNNASLPFAGREYGIIIVGNALSAGDFASTEAWLAGKTPGVTL